MCPYKNKDIPHLQSETSPAGFKFPGRRVELDHLHCFASFKTKKPCLRTSALHNTLCSTTPIAALDLHHPRTRTHLNSKSPKGRCSYKRFTRLSFRQPSQMWLYAETVGLRIVKTLPGMVMMEQSNKYYKVRMQEIGIRKSNYASN